MKIRFQVFVSSTYTDLIDARQRVFEKLLRRRIYMPVGMENFEAAQRTPWELITRRLDECDYMVTIVGDRSGSVGPNGKSYTEMEYDYAMEHKIPTVAFLKSDSSFRAVTKEEIAEASLVYEFREKCKRYHVGFWSSVDNLADQIVQAMDTLVDEFPRRGWIRGQDTFPFALGEANTSKYNFQGNWRTIFIEPDGSKFVLTEEVIDVEQSGSTISGTLRCTSYDRFDYFIHGVQAGDHIFAFHSADREKMNYGGVINLWIRKNCEWMEGVSTWESVPGHHVDQSKYIWYRSDVPGAARYQRAAMKIMKAELERQRGK